jgi:hypothetical protein
MSRIGKLPINIPEKVEALHGVILLLKENLVHYKLKVPGITQDGQLKVIIKEQTRNVLITWFIPNAINQHIVGSFEQFDLTYIKRCLIRATVQGEENCFKFSDIVIQLR